jgi:hypothetical protein
MPKRKPKTVPLRKRVWRPLIIVAIRVAIKQGIPLFIEWIKKSLGL